MSEDEIRHSLMLEKLKEDAPFDFNGNNCSETDASWNNGVPCDGWDGINRRCNCGNRRVSWELSDCKTYVYGQAY